MGTFAKARHLLIRRSLGLGYLGLSDPDGFRFAVDGGLDSDPRAADARFGENARKNATPTVRAGRANARRRKPFRTKRQCHSRMSPLFLPPNDFTDLDAVRVRLALYEKLSNKHPQPFAWKFTRGQLAILLERIAARERLINDYAKPGKIEP